LAVLKGTTLTGLDPGYVRDAQSLNKALVRLVEMARNPAPLDILQVKELHSLILEGHHGAGSFRTEPVSISGSTHKPPPTWKAVMDEMEKWEAWSFDNKHLDPILRGVVWCCTVGLHTFIRLLTEMVELHARSQTSNLSGKVILRSSYGETKIVSDTSMGYVSLTMLGIFRN